MTRTYSINGMTCRGCVAKVKSELIKFGEIISADVQLQSPQAVIRTNRHIGIKELRSALHKAGNFIIEEIDNATVPDSTHDTGAGEAENENGFPYLPVLLIFWYIAGVALLVQLSNRNPDWREWVHHFKAGFFSP